MGQYDVLAVRLQQQALEISRKVLGPEHPETVTSLNNLAYVYDAMGEYGKALSLYRQAADIRQRILARRTPKQPLRSTTWPPRLRRWASPPSAYLFTAEPWKSIARLWAPSTP